MPFEEVPSLRSLLNLPNDDAGMSLHDFGETEHVFLREHWIVTNDEVAHLFAWNTMVGGGSIGYALTRDLRWRRVKIIDDDVTLPVPPKDVFYFVPEIEPKLVDVIAL